MWILDRQQMCFSSFPDLDSKSENDPEEEEEDEENEEEEAKVPNKQ